MPWGRSDCRGRDSPRNSTGTPSDWKRGTLTSRATRAAVASAAERARPWTAGRSAVGCGRRCKQGRAGTKPAPQNGPSGTFVKQSCSMAQIELENQPEMVHPVRMGPPSCWMDQSVSQNLLRFGDDLLEKRPVVSHGGGTREGNGRVGAKRQDATAANAGTAATKTGISSSNRPNNQVPQRSINIENRMSAFSSNARPSGLLPRKNLSSESQMEDRHIHASHRQGCISLAHVAPPSAQWPAAPTSTSRAAQPSPAVDCRTPSKTPCSAQAW